MRRRSFCLPLPEGDLLSIYRDKVNDHFEEMSIDMGKVISFRCNICGYSQAALPSVLLERESPSCEMCGSTTRLRSIIRCLSLGLFGEALALPDFPKRKGLYGIGMSEWPGYLLLLEDRFDFLNTFYHQKPYLSISDPPAEMLGTADFLISSEVFEHVLPPVQRAFDGALALLKPRGFFILTVPFQLDGETDEHFPDLNDFKVYDDNGRYVLKNKTKDGRLQMFTDLCFHGGPGSTLELRLFSLPDLLRHLQMAGFCNLQVHANNDLGFGILYPGAWSVPITAKRPG